MSLNTVPEHPFEPGGACVHCGDGGSQVSVRKAVGREAIPKRMEMNGFMHVGRDDEEGVEGAPAAAREGDADDTHLRNRINWFKPGLKKKQVMPATRRRPRPPRRPRGTPAR